LKKKVFWKRNKENYCPKIQKRKKIKNKKIKTKNKKKKVSISILELRNFSWMKLCASRKAG